MIYFLTILAFVVDRLSKWWMTSYLAQHGPLQIHDLLVLRATYNRGMVFGLLQGTAPWMGWFSVLVIGALVFYLIRLPEGAGVMRAGLAIVVGGALGNLVDRLLVGQVLDFITSPLVPWVFNFADIFINGGMVIFAVGSLLYRPHEEPPKEHEEPPKEYVGDEHAPQQSPAPDDAAEP
ncbi:MAG TPA: signal peptidase II [Candidatus Binatia bacterium]|nr:signal peptidase II [Candidatus Binatia bacterium]